MSAILTNLVIPGIIYSVLLHSHDAITVFAAVATRPYAHCSSMEDRRCKSLITFLKRFFYI